MSANLARCLKVCAALAVILPVAGASRAAAKGKRAVPFYVRVTLAERYFSTQADGSSWESQAYVDADYRTTAHAGAALELDLAPTSEYGDFRAQLNGRGQSGTTNCTWTGLPIRSSEPLKLLGAPRASEEFSINAIAPWPDSPSAWTQTRTQASTAQCPMTFEQFPLQGVPPDGETMWEPQNTLSGASLNEHFYNAVTEQIRHSLEQSETADVQSVDMFSSTDYSDGEKYIVEAWGTIVQSHVPITGPPENNLLIVPDQSTAPLPSLSELTAQGLRELRKVPKGCVVGQRRRSHQRCV